MSQADRRTGEVRRMARAGALWLVLAGSAGLGGVPPAVAQGGDPPGGRVREAVTDPALAPGGSFFDLHDRVMAQTSPRGADQALAALRTRLEAEDADTLAAHYIRSLDGLRSAEITVGVIRAALGSDPAVLEPALARVRQQVVMPDGQSAQLPVLRAHLLHGWLLRQSADLLHRRGPPAELAGTYAASPDGACPFAPGPLQLVQRGPLLEGRRDGRLLCSLALGERGGTAVAEEVRYLSRQVAGGGDPAIVVPDQPSRIYRLTRVDAGVLHLDSPEGPAGPACRIVLRPQP